jgi:hypothetical protein
MKLLTMQYSPSSCHFLPLRFKYSPQQPAVYATPAKNLLFLVIINAPVDIIPTKSAGVS